MVVERLFAEQQPEVLGGESYLLRIFSRVFIRDRGSMRNIPRQEVRAFARSHACSSHSHYRNGQEHIHAFARWREEFREVSRRRRSVYARDIHGGPVREDRPAAQNFEHPVFQGLFVELQLLGPPEEGVHGTEAEVQEILVISIPLLEVVRGQEEPFTPEDFLQRCHRFPSVLPEQAASFFAFASSRLRGRGRTQSTTKTRRIANILTFRSR